MNLGSTNWWPMSTDETKGELHSVIITSSMWPVLWVGDFTMFCTSKLSSVSLKVWCQSVLGHLGRC